MSPGSSGSAFPSVSTWWPFIWLISLVLISTTARFDYAFSLHAALPIYDDTLVLYKFEEGQGDELKDSSGHNCHGQSAEAKTAEVDGPPLAPAPKANKQALDFNFDLKPGHARVEIPRILRPNEPCTIETN